MFNVIVAFKTHLNCYVVPKIILRHSQDTISGQSISFFFNNFERNKNISQLCYWRDDYQK